MAADAQYHALTRWTTDKPGFEVVSDKQAPERLPVSNAGFGSTMTAPEKVSVINESTTQILKIKSKFTASPYLARDS